MMVRSTYCYNPLILERISPQYIMRVENNSYPLMCLQRSRPPSHKFTSFFAHQLPMVRTLPHVIGVGHPTAPKMEYFGCGAVF